jgi:hypothetical protein
MFTASISLPRKSHQAMAGPAIGNPEPRRLLSGFAIGSTAFAIMDRRALARRCLKAIHSCKVSLHGSAICRRHYFQNQLAVALDLE